jgi:hypothetical protein
VGEIVIMRICQFINKHLKINDNGKPMLLFQQTERVWECDDCVAETGSGKEKEHEIFTQSKQQRNS